MWRQLGHRVSFSEVDYATLIDLKTRDRRDVTLVIDPLLCNGVSDQCLLCILYVDKM